MIHFAQALIKAAWSDALRRMGTTAFAVGASLLPWIYSLAYNLASGGFRVARANWTGGLIWTVFVWLALLAYSLCRHFRPVRREHCRVFRVLAVNQDQHTDPDRIAIWCLLQFCKNLGPLDLIVRVTTLLAAGRTTRVVHTEKLGYPSRDQTKRLPLGSLRIARPHRPAYHSIWGSEVGTEDLKEGQVAILTDTRNVIEISVGKQIHRIYVEFVTPPPGALSAAMYMTDEDHSPWILKL
jgi:hypothetical protein